MRILLVEPYFAGSHRAWAEGYAARSRHDVRLLTHPGRWWKWRMRGAALTLSDALGDLHDWEPEVVLVSGMVDLAHLRAFTRTRLGDLPFVLYLHESQLTYPASPRTDPDLSYGFTNWLSAVAADRVLFNSDYHREAFFDALPRLLGHFPDLTHEHHVEDVAARSSVLPPGVDLSWVAPERPRDRPPLVLWNHRWEHDKDPDAFAVAVFELARSGLPFRLALAGPRLPQDPPALEAIRRVAADRIVHDGELDVEGYRRLVNASAVVVSTARQEFFGVSVVEAVAAGCRPVLPHRLSYPWLVPHEHHDRVLYAEGALVPAVGEAIARPDPPPGLAASMLRFSWDRMVPQYDRLVEEVVSSLA